MINTFTVLLSNFEDVLQSNKHDTALGTFVHIFMTNKSLSCLLCESTAVFYLTEWSPMGKFPKQRFLTLSPPPLLPHQIYADKNYTVIDQDKGF